MSDVLYSGRTLDGLRVLERGGQLLGLPFAAGDGLHLTRVVTWGEPQRRLRYAARLLAVDLFTAEHARDAEEGLYQLLCSLPPDRNWQMRRSELLERAFYVRNVAMRLQGRLLTLPLLAVPEDGCYLRVLIDTSLGWLEVFAPEMEPGDHRENLTFQQELAGEAYPSLTPFPVSRRVRGDASDFLGDLARVQAFAACHGLVSQEFPARIMFMADKTPDFRAFMADAREALCLVRPGQPVTMERVFVPGEPVALADAVTFGQEARRELTQLFLELRRTGEPDWPRPQRQAGSVERARWVYRAQLEASRGAIWGPFLLSAEPRVREQLAPGWYCSGTHVLQITGPGLYTVWEPGVYVTWRASVPHGDGRADPAWLLAPEISSLPEQVNPVEARLPPAGMLWTVPDLRSRRARMFPTSRPTRLNEV